MVSNCGIIKILQAIIHTKGTYQEGHCGLAKFRGRGNVNVNIFVETQPIFNVEVSLASYYNSLSEYVQLFENGLCHGITTAKISH